MRKKKPNRDWGKSIKWTEDDIRRTNKDVKRIFTPPEIKFLDYNSEKK